MIISNIGLINLLTKSRFLSHWTTYGHKQPFYLYIKYDLIKV